MVTDLQSCISFSLCDFSSKQLRNIMDFAIAHALRRTSDARISAIRYNDRRMKPNAPKKKPPPLHHSIRPPIPIIYTSRKPPDLQIVLCIRAPETRCSADTDLLSTGDHATQEKARTPPERRSTSTEAWIRPPGTDAGAGRAIKIRPR